jgi:UDP-N-acetylglucosamine 2-epimerase (non-hydrolysing)
VKTVLSIVGTRPEAIKMGPVVRELSARPGFRSLVCLTGQHREMVEPVLALFEIVPDFDLAVMRPGQSLTDITTAVLTSMGDVLERVRPDWVLVQGDTTSAMAAALAAFYRKIAVGHVEAGLRTWDKYQPYPEEINRRIIGAIADLHFAPTEAAASSLRRERAPEHSIVVTGNTVIDAIQFCASLPFDPKLSELAALDVCSRRLVVVTAHRRENVGDGIERLCLAIRELADAREDVHFVYPVHLNPLVQAPVQRLLGVHPRITLLPPLDYRPLVWLLQRADLVITDSGGIQEEAPGLGKPVLVARETTERPEGVEAGSVKLVGTDRALIVEWVNRLLDDRAAYAAMATAVNPYGDGHAAQRIADALA